MLSIILRHAGYRGLTLLSFDHPHKTSHVLLLVLRHSFGHLGFLCLSARTIISFLFAAFVFIAGDYVSVCVEGPTSRKDFQ